MSVRNRRKISKFLLLCVISAAILANPALAQLKWEFLPLGDFAGGGFQSAGYDVSDDATVVVGQGMNELNKKAYYWSEDGDGMILLENSNLRSISNGVSANGQIAVGWVWNQSNSRVEAFRWTAESGAVGLGDLPGGAFESYTNEISADGKVVVGQGHTTGGYRAFRWSAQTGMTNLGELPGGKNHSSAKGVSSNGDVVVGASNSEFGQEAFLWSRSGGMVGLGDLPGGNFDSVAHHVLDNGNVVIGDSQSENGREAFRWTKETGMNGLGDLPDGDFNSFAWGGSADGSMIVGSGHTDLGQEAFIWDANNGMRNLKEVLESNHGVSLSGWLLNHAFAMNADGSAIVGRGINPGGEQEAWLAREVSISTQPEVAGDFNDNGFLDIDDIDLLTFQVRFEIENPSRFDLTNDSQVDDFDRLVWVTQIANTFFGDSNLDGEFNTNDLISVFQAGQYEDDQSETSRWGEGDWNGDGEFTSNDLVFAFQGGGYENGPRQASQIVPEPAVCMMFCVWLGILMLKNIGRQMPLSHRQ